MGWASTTRYVYLYQTYSISRCVNGTEEDMVMLDVAEEVLLRLTVKNLLRCKSVCKSWYSLISSPSFVKLHLKFICKKEDKNTIQHGNKRIAMISRYITLSGCYYILDIEGSSNGLVCISSIHNRLFLTNPSTRESRELHKPPILPKDTWYPRCYGFGYDSSTHDYKLVMAINQGSDDGTLVLTLSLKSNVWKLFGHVNYRFHRLHRFPDSEPGILFNGALHWFWFDANDITTDKGLIVSFDLAKQEFIEIPQPDDTRYDWSYGSRLGIIEDRLCIFHTHDYGRSKGIWVMKNYIVKPSWELLPDDYEMKDNLAHYIHMITNCVHRKKPTFFCGDKMWPSRWDATCIGLPIFVQTLVSPHVNNHGRPSDAKKNNITVEPGISKERREIQEVYTLKDGEKNAFHLDEDVETERKKRKRTSGKSRKKKQF